MREGDVREALLSHGIDFASHVTIVGTLRPSVAALANGMGSFMNLMREHVLHRNSSGLAIIPVSSANGQLSEDDIVFIPNERIRQIGLMPSRAHFELTVSTDDGDITYKVRRRVLGSPWHRENLAFLLLGATGAGQSS